MAQRGRPPRKQKAKPRKADQKTPPALVTEGGRHTRAVMGLINNTENDRLIRYQMFAGHYVRTGNAAEAARASGYKGQYPRKTGYNILNNPITKAFIADLLVEVDQEALIHRNEVIARLREIAESEEASDADKIRALSEMAKIAGMVEKSQTEVVINSGVMIIPEVKSVEDWQDIAEESQRQLKATVRE